MSIIEQRRESELKAHVEVLNTIPLADLHDHVHYASRWISDCIDPRDPMRLLQAVHAKDTRIEILMHFLDAENIDDKVEPERIIDEPMRSYARALFEEWHADTTGDLREYTAKIATTKTIRELAELIDAFAHP